MESVKRRRIGHSMSHLRIQKSRFFEIFCVCLGLNNKLNMRSKILIFTIGFFSNKFYLAS